MEKSVPLLITIFAAVTWALPTLTVGERGPFFNLAVPICFTYNATDGLDGRSPQTKSLSSHADGLTGINYNFPNDWIGLYESGACQSQENYIRPSDDYHARGDTPTSGMGVHQCHIATRSIPKPQGNPDSWSGEICFSLDEYRHSGNFDIRYFYGDDPKIDRDCSSAEFVGTGVVEGCSSPHYYWDGGGYVCNTNAGISGSVDITHNGTGCSDVLLTGDVEYTSAVQGSSCGFNEPGEHQPTDCAGKTCAEWEEYDKLYGWFASYGSDAANANEGHSPSQACCAGGGGVRWSHGCDCDPTAGPVEQQEACTRTAAACQRCALESVASITLSVLDSFSVGSGTQGTIANLPGFEIMTNS